MSLRRPLSPLSRAASALAGLLLAAGLAHGADQAELAEREAKTDKTNPEQLFELAQWCDQNGLKTKALKYYNAVVSIDKDHEAARAALGQVKVGNNWISAKTAGKPVAKPNGGNGNGDADVPESSRQAKGKGPTAAEVKWNLTVPPDPKQDEFVQKYIDRLSGIQNDSDEMSNAVATMLMDEHLASSISRLAKGYADGRLTDLYGACDLIIALEKSGRLDVAKPLLPFLVKGSEKVTDPEDLSSFCFAASMFHDRRAIPRLIELMDNGNVDVKTAATDAVAALTLLPPANLTSARATQWWDLNHDVSEQQVYGEQLNSRDPAIAVQAARALYAFRDKAIVPVLIRLLKSEDRAVNGQAIEVIRKISGNEWGYNVAGTADEKKKSADRVEAWWKEEQFRWVWIEDREAAAAKAAAGNAAAAAPTDPNVELVSKLGSATGNESQLSEASLRSTGEKAVPALIGGLESADRIVRRKSSDLLKEIGKQEIPYDPAGEPADRAKGVAAWRAWAEKKGLIAAGTGAAEDTGAADAPAADPGGEDEEGTAKRAPKPAPKKPQPAPQDPAKKQGPEKGKVPGTL